MRQRVFAAALTLISSQALAQTPDSRSSASGQPQGVAAVDVGDAGLATPTGHDVNLSVSGYTYTEPDGLRITIHGPRFGGEYTGTLSLSKRQHWFVQAGGRGTIGSVTYDGWCSPWEITPNSASPNGYELDVGDASPCSESGDRDWYAEARTLIGKDFIGQHWAFSPAAGVGLRHLSNGTTGTAGYRTDDYLYLPIGMTARTGVASRGAVSFNLEYDRLIHGWQKTRDSKLGGGLVEATSTAPAFVIEGFTDISFVQRAGWALRASAKYQVSRNWSLEPYFLHWAVGASPVNYETVTFTVNGVSAKEQLGAYEPRNVTNEFGLKFGFHF